MRYGNIFQRGGYINFFSYLNNWTPKGIIQQMENNVNKKL